MKKTENQKKQSLALQDALEQDKSLFGAIRTLHRIEKEFSDIFTLTDLQREILALNDKRSPMFIDAIKSQFNSTQRKKWDQETEQRFKITVDFVNADERQTFQSGFKSEKKANEYVALLKDRFTKKNWESVEVKEYLHEYKRIYTPNEVLSLVQRIESKYHDTFTESAPKVTATLLANLLGYGTDDKAKAQSKEALKRSRQSQKTKEENEENVTA